MSAGMNIELNPESIITNIQDENEDVSYSDNSKTDRLKNLVFCICCCFRQECDKKNCHSEELSYALPQQTKSTEDKVCLVVDLDETLVHSSFKPQNDADFIVPVQIDEEVHQVYVRKRPHVDHFISQIGSLFECILFTASLAKYADPVIDLLDKGALFRFRLFRESCIQKRGCYIKDLSILGRPLNRVAILDNSPSSYLYHKKNAIPITSWFGDPNDSELLDILPSLNILSSSNNVFETIPTITSHKNRSCLNINTHLLLSPLKRDPSVLNADKFHETSDDIDEHFAKDIQNVSNNKMSPLEVYEWEQFTKHRCFKSLSSASIPRQGEIQQSTSFINRGQFSPQKIFRHSYVERPIDCRWVLLNASNLSKSFPPKPEISNLYAAKSPPIIRTNPSLKLDFYGSGSIFSPPPRNTSSIF